MTWTGIDPLMYTSVYSLLLILTHPDDYDEYISYIKNDLPTKYNIDPYLVKELLFVNDPNKLISQNTKIRLKYYSGKSISMYREGKTCVALWYRVHNIVIYKLFELKHGPGKDMIIYFI